MGIAKNGRVDCRIATAKVIHIPKKTGRGISLPTISRPMSIVSEQLTPKDFKLIPICS